MIYSPWFIQFSKVFFFVYILIPMSSILYIAVHRAADILSLSVHIKQRGHNSNHSKGFQKSL